MSGNQSGRICGEPLEMGISISAPISSEVGSSSLFFAQPIFLGKVSASSAVLISAEAFLFIAERFFKLKSLPILDARNGQTVQMPLSELQEFLHWLANEPGAAGVSPEPNPVTDGRNRLTNTNGQIEGTDVPSVVTITTPEAPLIVSLYISANYSDSPFTPSVFLFVPVLTFPGLRGALPLLILSLLATIFVRAVVPPESTGAKPLAKPEAGTNNPLPYTPHDLLHLISKFGRQVKTKKQT